MPNNQNVQSDQNRQDKTGTDKDKSKSGGSCGC